jgi:hypothetical protein
MDTTSRYLLAISGCSFWLWAILLPQTALRYVFQMFPPLSLLTAYLLWHLPISRRGKTWIGAGVSLLLIYHLLLLFGPLAILQPFKYLLSNLSKEEFLVKQGVNYYPAIQYVNLEVPKDAKILYVGELRGYYCERDFLLATDAYRVDDEIILRKLIVESQSVHEVIQKLKQLNITHFLLNLSEMRRFARGKDLARESYFGFQTEKDQEIFQRLFSPQYLRLLLSKFEVTVYEVLYPEKDA